jgi:hypothetical protein
LTFAILVDHREADAVRVFVDEDEVADQQRRDHRTGGNLERLDEKGAHQKDDQDHWEEALRIFDPPRLLRSRPPLGSQQRQIE